MGNIFGEHKTTRELVREQKRLVDRAARALDRDRQGIERDEKKLIMDIKKAAKANQVKSVKIMAKDLVRIRKHQEKFLTLSAQLRAIGMQMTAMGSTVAITESMKKVTKAMVKMSKEIDMPAMNKIMVEYMKQSEGMEMKSEMIGDAIDQVMDDDEDEKESDMIVNQVLDEIGVSVNDGLVDVPGKRAGPVEVADEKDKALEARFNNLGQ